MGSAAASMAYALGSLSMEDYFSVMSTAFSGNEIDALNDFINDYEYTLPDTQEIGNQIRAGLQSGMEKYLPEFGLDENQTAEAIDAVMRELTAERGPNFQLIPAFLTELGLDQEQQNRVLHALQDFLEGSLVRAVGEVDGLTQVVKTVMTRGLTGALDAVIRDLQPEQQLQINFFD